MRVIKDRQARCAIELSTSPKQRALIRISELGEVVLDLHPEEWLGVPLPGQMRPPTFIFDEYWKPLIANGQPYAVHEAARRFLRGINNYPKIVPSFGYGAVEALVNCLPEGDINLFTYEGGFVGRFAALDDAQLISRARKETPIVFESLTDLKKLPGKDLRVVESSLDPSREWPAKATPKLYQEILTMTKKATKVTPKKVQKVEVSRKRADGPVAQARLIFTKMKNETESSKIIAACVAAGINKGTAGVQLGRWRKEQGITVKRGGARPKPEKKVVAKGKKTPAKSKPAAKGKPVAKSKPAAKGKPAVAPVAAGAVVNGQPTSAPADQPSAPAAAS